MEQEITFANLPNATEQITTIPRNRKIRKKLVDQFGEFQAAVAGSLGVSRAAVNQVWQLRSSSERITAALIAELNRRIAERAENGGA